MDARLALPNVPSPRPARRKRLVDFADPAVWAWIVVAVLLVIPAAATLA